MTLRLEGTGHCKLEVVRHQIPHGLAFADLDDAQL